ncbi:sensor histidine kinase [Phormidesmis sp. 146-12]
MHSSRLFRWIFRWTEWLLLLSIALAIIVRLYRPYQHEVPQIQIPLLLLTILGIFFALSLSFPIHRPMWQRRLYLCGEMLLLMIAQSLAAPGGFYNLFFVFVAKSCFLLRMQEMIVLSVVAGIVYMIGGFWFVTTSATFQTFLATVQKCDFLPQGYRIDDVLLDLVPQQATFVAFNAFIILLSIVLHQEQTTRHRAEKLAQEVDALATKLERTRIAREIHDSLGHSLTDLGVKLELAQTLRDHHPEKALRSLDSIKQVADQCLQNVRYSLQAFRQDHIDLTLRLEQLIEQFKRTSAVSCPELSIDWQVKLPTLSLQTSHQLYAIVQEGLTNIRKHAQASQVRLHMGTDGENQIVLELEDNGRGFDLSDPPTGFGLRGIRERVEILGGQFQIESILQQGTRLQVRVPQ